MNPQDQDRLLAGLKSNNSLALKEIFESLYPLVYQTILRVVEDTSLAEDLAQEVFIRFWNKRHEIDIKYTLPAYLKKMALNQALRHLRSNKTRFSDEVPLNEPMPVTENPDHVVLDRELGELMDAAIDSLPERCKLVFRLSRYEGLSYQEIADAMEISIKTVENQMGKALKILREKMKPYLDR